MKCMYTYFLTQVDGLISVNVISLTEIMSYSYISVLQSICKVDI